ncbi:MAG: Fic family protein [Verrucomicrobiae bacterium]|nr:Fic family protein [Verrucomicrobiae bacterium]
MKPFVTQKLPIQKLDWEKLLPWITQATGSLAEYKGALYRLPHVEVLLAPLMSQEAVLSSQIEGTHATLSEVFKFEAGDEAVSETKRNDIQEILNYRSALQAAKEKMKTHPFSLNLLLHLHGILLDSVRGYNKNRGNFRKTQNWIGRPGSTLENAHFVPPEAHLLPEYLDNWEKYYHADERDVLVQLATLHAQFELLHPFLDGNGRLGRILIPLFLYEKKILPQPLFYLSDYLEIHRETYMDRLHQLGQTNQWEDWVVFFMKAIAHQSKKNLKTIYQIVDLYESLKERVLNLTRSRWAIPMLDQIFKQPIFQSRIFRRGSHAPSAQSISVLLNLLIQENILKILKKGKGGRSGNVFVLSPLIDLYESRSE